MIKLYKSYKDYSEQENCHRHTAKIRVEKWLKDWSIQIIPKWMKYIRLYE